MPPPLTPEIEDKDIVRATDTTTTETEDGKDAPIIPEHLRTSQQEATDEPTLVLKTHDGNGYILPYLPWEATKNHIEQIYRLRGRESFAEAIKDGNFSMLTEHGNIILPLFWDSVIKPSTIVQVSLPSEVLDSDSAWFRPNERRIRSGYQPSVRSEFHYANSATRSAPENVERTMEESEKDSSASQDESEIEDTSSESELSEIAVPADTTVQVSQTAVAPVDDEGNDISFQINTAFVGPLDQNEADTNPFSSKREPQQSAGDAKCLEITKAVLVKVESRSILRLHVLPGPRSVATRPDVSMQWHHIHSEKLDFAQFKEACLGVSGLSERTHKLTRKLFERVEKEKLKAFLDGMFIEPGTVLRADESHQSEPQSAIFSCIPYFYLQAPARKVSIAGRTDRFFPSRTLMQSCYPYEPVRERDAEQAYRKFGNKNSDALVHVPNLWMVNIGSDIVVTCGHQALSKEFVQSIEVIKASPDQHKKEYHTVNIRLTDWEGRKLLFSLEECRSYLQMEQRLKELRWCFGRSQAEQNLQLSWQMFDKNIKVTATLWTDIIKKEESVFIDLSLLKEQMSGDKDGATTELSPSTAWPPNPFFHWPQSARTDGLETDSPIRDDISRAMRCLEHVEKAMLSEVLKADIYETYNAVEKTFTSTVYYRNLSEETSGHIKSNIESLAASNKKLAVLSGTADAVHQALIYQQHSTISQKTLELYKTMRETVVLFVADPDKSTVLRKLWGAMRSISDIITTVCKREPLHHNLDKFPDSNWKRSTMYGGWFVRPRIDDTETSVTLKKLKRAFEKCRKCGTTEMYTTRQAALLHVQRHFKHAKAYDIGALDPEEWVVNYAQKKMEVWNEGFIAILTKSSQKASKIFNQIKELSDGVRNEDGQTSELYTFPRALISVLRQTLVFYFAVERAIYYTEDSFKDETNAFEEPEYLSSLPFSPNGLQVIEVFGNGAQQSVVSARNELCSMVKSTEPMDVFKRLSLSSEYVCGWLMRRLIVKPLEKSMTTSDMYREYVSTVQFQVNHRPGKRLLRSINLLQEELTALLEVNTQQMRLISNYKSVLDDASYEKCNVSRRAMFPFERLLLASCQDNLKTTDQEYRYLIARCGPLSDSAKQSLEINEEDHGKAIMVFTTVTVIFLPLSFVTSFLGMNTTDIRDMGSSSSLFWAIAVPLTIVTMGSILYIGYQGDKIRDTLDSLYRTVTGKQDRSASARGISVAQRKRARKSATESNSTVDFSSLADEAEFANPRPDGYYNATYRDQGGAVFGGEWDYAAGPRPPRRQYTLEPPTMEWEPYISAPDYMSPDPRTGIPHPNVKIYNTTRVDNRLAQTSYPPPPPPIPPRYPLYTPTGPSRPFARNIPVQDYILTEELPSVRRSDRLREEVEHEIAPAQYEWTKRSHRNHRHKPEDARQGRTMGRNVRP